MGRASSAARRILIVIRGGLVSSAGTASAPKAAQKGASSGLRGLMKRVEHEANVAGQ